MNDMEAGELHAHVVMEMMVSSGKRYDRASLLAEISKKFGEGAKFHACCASGMDGGELIDFLEAKGKFTGPADAFAFDAGEVCSGH